MADAIPGRIRHPDPNQFKPVFPQPTIDKSIPPQFIPQQFIPDRTIPSALPPGQGSSTSVGAFKDVVPVAMSPNDTPDRTVLPANVPDPDVGIRWGRQSAFVLANQNTDADTAAQGQQTPPPVYVKNSPIHKDGGNRLEGFSAVKVEYHNYSFPAYEWIASDPPQPAFNGNAEAELPFTVWLSLGKENQQEIAGFTAFPDGSVKERYKQVIVDRYLELDCSGFFPNDVGVSRIDGEIPPP